MARDTSDSISIGAVIEAVQALPDIDEDLILDACDFLENKTNAQIFIALDLRLRRKCLIRKLPRQITIFVRTPDGKIIELEVLMSDTIGEVKAKIEEKLRIIQENQLLFFAAKKLEDNRTLADYHVLRGATLLLRDSTNDLIKEE